MIATMEAKKRMGMSDYIVICMRQSLLGAGQTDVPNNPREMFIGLDNGRWPASEYQAALDLAWELFGNGPCEDGTHLFKVKELTVKESAIAGRMDLTHAEKIKEIGRLREKRQAASEAAQQRADSRPSKYELEYRRQSAERIAAAVAETMVVSADDRTLAAEMGIKLD